ncbi:hypothetical protein BD560DRAFT_376624, partial [Blakeslea trispora]
FFLPLLYQTNRKNFSKLISVQFKSIRFLFLYLLFTIVSFSFVFFPGRIAQFNRNF